MKKRSDPRHKMRILTFKTLFELNFRPNAKLPESSMSAQVISKKKEIDGLIIKNAKSWPIDQINPVDLSTLRLAIWELLFKEKKEPYKVIIDEAVEIAKEYGTETSGSFVNGVLVSIIKSRVKARSHNYLALHFSL